MKTALKFPMIKNKVAFGIGSVINKEKRARYFNYLF